MTSQAEHEAYLATRAECWRIARRATYEDMVAQLPMAQQDALKDLSQIVNSANRNDAVNAYLRRLTQLFVDHLEAERKPNGR